MASAAAVAALGNLVGNPELAKDLVIGIHECNTGGRVRAYVINGAPYVDMEILERPSGSLQDQNLRRDIWMELLSTRMELGPQSLYLLMMWYPNSHALQAMSTFTMEKA